MTGQEIINAILQDVESLFEDQEQISKDDLLAYLDSVAAQLEAGE